MPFLEAPLAGPAREWLARGTRRLINPGNIDGCEGLPGPQRQRDGWVRPKRGGCVCGHVSAPPPQVSAPADGRQR